MSPLCSISLPPLVIISGADIIASTILTVYPGTPLNYHWEGHGLKLHIPADALQKGTLPQTLRIFASLSGQYQLPHEPDTELVSGVYWIHCPCEFSCPVTVEVQHCAHLENSDQLSSLFFVTAKCTQRPLPYQFKPLPGGVFSTSSQYGAIEMNHFSAIATARRKKGTGKAKGKGKEMGKEKRKGKGEMKNEEGSGKRYTGHIFYIPKAVNTWLMHFTIFWDIDLYLRVCIINFCNLQFIYIWSSGPFQRFSHIADQSLDQHCPVMYLVIHVHLCYTTLSACNRQWRGTTQEKELRLAHIWRWSLTVMRYL